jgi:hypothetical protein
MKKLNNPIHYRRVFWITLTLCLLFQMPTAHAASDTKHIEQILNAMATQSETFDPDELIKLGQEGLAVILDVLMPESSGYFRITEQEVALLVKDLGHMHYAKRRSAIKRLIAAGGDVRKQVEVAATSSDLETAMNAKAVLHGILNKPVMSDREANSRQTHTYGKAYGRYLATLQDEACWQLIAMRTTQALIAGRDSTGNTDDFMWQSFTTLAKRGNDATLSLFRPVIQIKSASHCHWVFDHLRIYSKDGFMPTVLKDIVQTDHVYNETHLRRRLEHIRQHGPDAPYKPTKEEVLAALNELIRNPTGPTTKTFLSYEEAALELLFSLSDDERRAEATQEKALIIKGTIKKGDTHSKSLTIERNGSTTVLLKHISLLELVSEKAKTEPLKAKPVVIKLKYAQTVKARHILFMVKPDDGDNAKAEKRQKAEALRKAIMAGADFAKMAKEHSDCPSKRAGGDLGSFKQGMMVKPFEEASFTSPIGVIGPVIETQFGYHIIEVLERTE